MARGIREWLEGLGLSKYVDIFAANDVDLDVLQDLDEKDLERLGVSLGHRKKLLRAIADLETAPILELVPIVGEIAKLPAGAERRQLTVMFVDLVGSTALSRRLDPEVMREVIRAYQNLVAGEVTRFEGYVAKLMGDGVLIYFGWPQAHEDEAELAVRAGLAIANEVSRLTTPAGGSLAVRVGIASGLVVVGDLIGEGAAQEEAVVGDAPNLAARLQALAEPGSVVIGLATRRQIGELFELESLGDHQLKGFDQPVPAWRVVRESGTEGRFEALHGQRLSPLVGRGHEIGLLLELLERAKDGEGQVVLLSGEPGIGKSRIIRELRDRLRDESYTFLNHFCSPLNVNSALHPIIGLLERAARFEREDVRDIKLEKLEALLAKASKNVCEIAPIIAALLSIPIGERYPTLNLTPDEQKQRTFEVLLDQLAALAAQQPVIAVYEDVHWADPSTLDLLDSVVERAQRLAMLVIITFRPEFVPPWSGRGQVTSLMLGRLGRRQGAAMIDATTGGKPLPAEVLDQIVTKTDGVPLFIEELTKTLLESGFLRETADRFVLSAPLPPLAIPPTLHDSLLARLDRLGPAKETAQLGAALGREFSHELLAAVAELGKAELHQALDQLQRAGLIFRQGVPPQATYAFKHALVRDAAYAGLLMSTRRRLHFRIARVLKEQFPERATAEPELLARHFTEAGEAFEAIQYWLTAGQRAAERSANVEAVAHLRQGLKLIETLPDTDETARLELALQSALGMPLIATKGYSAIETGTAYDRAHELCDRIGSSEQLFPILYGQGVFRLGYGQFRKAQSLFEEFLCLAGNEGAAGPTLVAHRMLGTSLFLRGELSAGRRSLEEALSLYDLTTHRALAFQYGADTRSAALAWLALDLCLLGFPTQAERAGHKAIALAKDIAHAITQAHALRIGGCFLSVVRRDIRGAREHAAALKAYSAQQRMPLFRAVAEFILACTSAESGPTPNTVSRMRTVLAEIEAGELRANQPFLFSLLAEACAGARQAKAGLGVLDEALAAIETPDEFWWVAEIYRLKGLLLSLDTDNALAEVCYRKAISIAQRQGARWLELRAATHLARLWHTQGKYDEARAQLAPVYGGFTEGFDTPDLRDAKAMLEKLGKAPSSSSFR
jgi:class 3 adenylate cyclase/tetratricopeptide (TPR) repeat protein